MEFPNEQKPTEEEMVNSFVKTLAAVVGGHRIKNGFEEEAKKEIYCQYNYLYWLRCLDSGRAFLQGDFVRIRELAGVLWVLPDSYLDVPNTDYGGDLFIVGKVIARDNKVVEIGLVHGTIDVQKLCILNGGNQY